jgi:hypothetical protein
VWDRSVRGERALLGAVLLDPAAQQHVLGLVEPGDFARPWHAQVLAAMQRACGRGVLPDAAEVYRELQNDPDLPRSVARDAVPLAGLMDAAPRARHAPAYAAMVVEGGIRERLRFAGSCLEQAAATGELETAWQQTDAARHELGACTARWSALPAQLRRTLPVDSRAVAGHQASPPPARSCDEQTVADGVNALRDLAAAPSALPVVSTWLRPEHFARPDDGALFAVMRDMHACGMPVDPVTVSWQAARRGLHAEPGSLSDGMGPSAVPACHGEGEAFRTQSPADFPAKELELPGPVERTLNDLGITSPELLQRGSEIDRAAEHLIIEAATRLRSPSGRRPQP